MKRVFTATTFIIVLSVFSLMMSCKDEETPAPSFKSSVTAKIGTATFNAATVTSTIQSTWVITIATNGTESITFTIPKATAAGQFSIPASGNYSVLYTKGTLSYASDNGTMIITNHDAGKQQLAGTYSCNMTCTTNSTLHVTIASGSFNIQY